MPVPWMPLPAEGSERCFIASKAAMQQRSPCSLMADWCSILASSYGADFTKYLYMCLALQAVEILVLKSLVTRALLDKTMDSWGYRLVIRLIN